MMRENKLKRRWEAGADAVNVWLDIGWPVLTEALAHLPFDAMTVDLQHSLLDRGAAVGLLQAISLGGATPMVRVAANDPTEIGFALDAGALGIICPLIETGEDCARFVASCRYPPDGTRSWGPVRGLLWGGADYFQHANSEIARIALIETRRAIDNLEAIASTPGLDAIYLGPNDMAISYGGAPSYLPSHPPVLAAIERMLEVAYGAGIVPAIHCGSPEMAKAMLEKGFRLVTMMSDTKLLLGAAAKALDVVGRPPR
jgi:4-hydroxy-2-oxoheptanedioate aldolase